MFQCSYIVKLNVIDDIAVSCRQECSALNASQSGQRGLRMCMRPVDRLGGAAILQQSKMKGMVSSRGEHLKWDGWEETELATEE